MRLIVGLGNIGEKYEKTRHNLGFMVVEALGRKWDIGWSSDGKFESLRAQRKAEGTEVILVKPQTMMNASGLAVGKIASFYKILPGDIWVVHDEIDLPLGKVKIILGRGAAGHRGVESIIKALGTEEFVRFRCGIRQGKIPIEELKHVDVEKFVLKPFEPRERRGVERMIKKVVEAIEEGLKEGLSVAMNRFN